MAKELVIEMDLNKETKGAVRYGDGEGHSIYFRKEEVAEHKFGDTVVVTITNKKKS